MIYFIILFLFTAQFNEPHTDTTGKKDASKVVLNTVLSEQAKRLSLPVQNQLRNKLNQISTRNGMGGNRSTSRFVLAADINTLHKDIVKTVPPMHSYSIEYTFLIGDAVEGSLFGSYSEIIEGIGRSDAQAFMAAINSIDVNNSSIANFLEEGKGKIITHYKDNCDLILQEASSLSERREYDIALKKLAEIPSLVSGCYETAMNQAVNVYDKKMENECEVNLSFARQYIANNDWKEALSHIGGYTPDMKCYSEINEMYISIQKEKCSFLLGAARGAWAERNANKASFYLAQISETDNCSESARELSAEIGRYLDEEAKNRWELELEKNRADNRLAQTLLELSLQKGKMDVPTGESVRIFKIQEIYSQLDTQNADIYTPDLNRVIEAAISGWIN